MNSKLQQGVRSGRDGARSSRPCICALKSTSLPTRLKCLGVVVLDMSSRFINLANVVVVVVVFVGLVTEGECQTGGSHHHPPLQPQGTLQRPRAFFLTLKGIQTLREGKWHDEARDSDAGTLPELSRKWKLYALGVLFPCLRL